MSSRLKILRPGIAQISNVLSKSECSNLIRFGEFIGFQNAAVRTNNGQKMMTDLRNNERIIFTDPNLANELWNRVKQDAKYFKSTSTNNLPPIKLNDYFRIYKYSEGQRFNQHKDGKEKIDGLVSHVSVLFYLNEDDLVGGNTQFFEYVRNNKNQLERIKTLDVEPEEGSALMFWHKFFHKGDEVLSGNKYVLRSDLFYDNM